MKKLIAFFEIPASDFHRAVDFYETVLGMQLPTFECETELSPEDAASHCKSLFKKTPEGSYMYFSIQPDGFFG